MTRNLILIFFFGGILISQAQDNDSCLFAELNYLMKPGFETLYLEKSDTVNKLIIYENYYSKIFVDKNEIIVFIKNTLSQRYTSKCDLIITDTLLCRLEHGKTRLFVELESISNSNQFEKSKMTYILRDIIISNKVAILNKDNNSMASEMFYRRTSNSYCCCNHILSIDFEQKQSILSFGCSHYVYVCD